MDDKRLEEIRGYLNGWTRREYERLPFHYKVLHPKTVELLTAYDAKCAELATAKAELEKVKAAALNVLKTRNDCHDVADTVSPFMLDALSALVEPEAKGGSDVE